jgi:hypothetical protein
VHLVKQDFETVTIFPQKWMTCWQLPKPLNLILKINISCDISPIIVMGPAQNV